MIFSLDGVFMEIWLVPYTARIHIIFVLISVRRYVISIVIDVFFLQTTHLGSKEKILERILLWEMELQGVEPVRRLLRNWIAWKLVMVGRSLKDIERSIIGLTNVGYGSYHIPRTWFSCTTLTSCIRNVMLLKE
jgi:hypothetical protein